MCSNSVEDVKGDESQLVCLRLYEQYVCIYKVKHEWQAVLHSRGQGADYDVCLQMRQRP